MVVICQYISFLEGAKRKDSIKSDSTISTAQPEKKKFEDYKEIVATSLGRRTYLNLRKFEATMDNSVKRSCRIETNTYTQARPPPINVILRKIML